MLTFNLKLSEKQQIDLQCQLVAAQTKGDLSEVKRILALIALGSGQLVEDIADILQITIETIRQALNRFLVGGIKQLCSKKRPGRPSKLTKSQRKQLAKWIEMGPEKVGFPGACWRTPMLQWLIQEKFGVFYNTHYISELLHNMGFSFQKAKFVAAKKDDEKRAEWLKEKWPEILKLSNKKNASILFGDEASFPQWGTLNYTWAPIGQQPVVQTSGNRRSYKVFGLIDYFTGNFYSKGHEGKLNSESYIEFLLEVLSKTRKHLILIQDGAPYHRGAAMKEFFKKHADRITVFRLPSYSPDYNPIEQLWKKVKQAGTHLHYFPTFDCLVNKVEDMLQLFGDVKKEVLSLFGFYRELVVA